MNWLSQAAPWLALLGAIPLLYALSLLLATLNCMRLRLRAAPMAVVERQALEPESRAVLDAMQPELQALGFTWCASLQGTHPQAMDPDLPLEVDLFVHADGRAWAMVQAEQAGSARHGRTVGSVTWLTFFADGRNWMGFNGLPQTSLPAPPGWTYLDDAQPDTASAWAAYAERLSGDRAPVVQGLDQALQRLDEWGRSQVPALVAQGRALPAGPGFWRLSWRESLRLAWRALRQVRKEDRPVPASPSAGACLHGPQVRQVSEALRFRYQKAVQRGLGMAHNRHRSFWITAALFLAAGAVLFSWDMAWMLLVVIAVHEGGHWLAMRWAGYQRQSVFFIPGLGGMATGEKADATPLQKVGVYLAGPMPGLLLAVGALAAVGWGLLPQPPAWTMQLLLLTLVVNAFNLLPLTPLDGGRVVESLLFARLPAMRLVFALAGMAALGGLAWFSRDPLISILTGVLLMGLPWQWRVMQLERAVHRTLHTLPQQEACQAPVSEADAVHRAFGVLQQPAFARWPFVRRAAVAGALLPALQSRAPGWAEGAAGLAIYLACLLLPVAMVMGIHQAAPQGRQVLAALWDVELSARRDYVPEQHLAEIEARLAQADQLPPSAQEQRVEIYLEAARELQLMDDHPPAEARAKALYQSAWAMTQSRAQSDLQRAHALKGMADTADTAEQATNLRQQLVADLQDVQGPARRVLASVQEVLAFWGPPDQTVAQRLDRMVQAVEIRRADADAPDDFLLLHARIKLARLLDASGHPEAAQAQLQANVIALQAALQAAPQAAHAVTADSAQRREWKIFSLMQAETLHARFMAEHGQTGAAVALARQSVERTPPKKAGHYAAQDSWIAWLWIAIGMGDAAEVRQALAQQLPASRAYAEIGIAQARLAAAQLLNDDALRMQALAALQPLSQARHVALCRSPRVARDLHSDWQNLERRLQHESAQAAGLCPR
ncbi:peptidase M50 [Delftia sp. Lp-1]|uniref:site-2 protease family protein n=1 Tax=Delftia sp. Lp-1 TaxID=682863 RepID=UPI001E43606B|nr:site-2 protease family protein [Delftia sp. Lp-1]MCB4785686.1 peptidase M50 [Delftia sp. Lp-1]